MSPECLKLVVYIAVSFANWGHDRAWQEAPNYATYGHALFQASPIFYQITAVLKILKFKHLSLNRGCV